MQWKIPLSTDWQRRLGQLAYRVVRPVARPVAWRGRSFLTTDLNARLDAADRSRADIDRRLVEATRHVEARLDDLTRLLAEIDVRSRAIADALRDAADEAERRHVASNAELAAFTAQVERLMLTLAADRRSAGADAP